MKMIQPFGDRVLIKVESPPQQTASGLYLPDSERVAPSVGEIVAIGQGSPLQEKLSLGEHILFQKHAGTEIHLEDGLYVLLSEADILGRMVEVERVGSSR